MTIEQAGRRLAALLLLACTPGFSQSRTPVPPGPATSAQTPATAQSGQTGDTIISKDQARELFASIDQIMHFASTDSGLPEVVNVKRRLVTRDEVSKYLIKSFAEDESAKRLERSEIVLKKFGLLERDFNLRPFLLSLLTEQIAGYYDDKSKTVNLLNWVDPEEQKPVMAHELTHALQDQKVGLEHWSSDGFKGVSRTTSDDNSRIASDELETARQAVAEGQAMVVFVDYTLRKTGQTLADVPDEGKRIREAAADPSGSPLMSRAPLLLQRSLMFPYSDGLGFEQALLQAGGKTAAFSGVLAAPPSTSFEIMNPQAYLHHVAPPVLRLPDLHTLLDAEYAPYDVGAMGELDVEMMAGLFGGPELATALSSEWAGGVYYAAQRRSATPAEKLKTGSLGLLYYSQWRSDEAARGFEKLYVAELGRKYARVSERPQDEGDGETIYTTNEGDVLLSRSDKGLFLSEGFPLATARKLRESVVSSQSTGPVRMAGVPQQELLLGTVSTLQSFGVIRSAFPAR